MSSTTYQSPYKPTPSSTPLDAFARWLRLKKYRIEVTYGVYVYTPMEKVAFWTLFCFFFVLISTAVLLYTHRSLRFLVRVAASHIDADRQRLIASLTSRLRLPIANGLTAAAAQMGGVEKATNLISGAARNSQVA
ncbi:hypothetical protein F5Y14DRAFT_456018 [Nemania sp. NC0429]|nr:hypothetical protein F5Y14DRAFT_456018 [Nemania sp. NC0429]